MLSIIDRKSVERLNAQSAKIPKSLRVRFCSRVGWAKRCVPTILRQK